MKKIVLALLVLASCAKEDSVGPASAPTFIRYFNGGNSDEAKAILETPDKGLLILATTQIIQEGETEPIYKIKLIKTDAYGNLIWQKLYPEFGNDTYVDVTVTKYLRYKGNGFAMDPSGGYVIVGEDIKDQKSQLLVISVDDNGILKNSPKTMTSTYEAKGMGVVVITSPTNSTAGNVRILSAVTDPVKDNMLLAEFTGAMVNGSNASIRPSPSRV